MKIIKQADSYSLDISHEEWIKLGEENRWLKSFSQNQISNDFSKSNLLNSGPDYLEVVPTPQSLVDLYNQYVSGDLDKEDQLEDACHQHIENMISALISKKNILSSEEVDNIINSAVFTVSIEETGVYILGNKGVNSLLDRSDLEIISRSLDSFALELSETFSDDFQSNDDIINIL